MCFSPAGPGPSCLEEIEPDRDAKMLSYRFVSLRTSEMSYLVSPIGKQEACET